MNNTVLIGIDPGANGCIAVMSPDGTIQADKMPETATDLALALQAIEVDAFQNAHNVRCYLEEVGGYIGEAQPASSAFKFGQGFGRLEGVLAAVGISTTLVRPQAWQKALGCANRRSCGSKPEHKRKLKEQAQRLYPNIAVTLTNADALLIIEYARRIENITATEPKQKELIA